MFQRKTFAEGFYVKEISAKNIFTAASNCPVKIMYSASRGTTVMILKSFSAAFSKPFMNAVAPPFLVMLYFSDDSSHFSGSDYEIRCKQCEWDIQQRSCLVCHRQMVFLASAQLGYTGREQVGLSLFSRRNGSELDGK